MSQIHTLETYEAVQKRLELRELESEYLTDERDAVDGEVSDSDAEFESIVEIDRLLKELSEVHSANVRSEEDLKLYHERMLVLMQKMQQVADLLEFESEDLWRTFDEVIAGDLFEINNLDWLCEMAKIGCEMELPYKAFWGAVVNVALLKHQEFPFFDATDSFKEQGAGSAMERFS